MSSKKICITQGSKSLVKHQLDQLLAHDYKHMRHNQHRPQEIFNCQISQRNPLIKQYIEELQVQYNIPSPLKYNSKEISSSRKSNTKIQLSIKSIKSSFRSNEGHLKQSRNFKRLSLVSGSQPEYNSCKNTLNFPKYESIQLRPTINTPKFNLFPQPCQIKFNNPDPIPSEELMSDRRNLLERQGSIRLNNLSSKEKPRINTQSNIVISYPTDLVQTAKKKSHSSHSESQVYESGMFLEQTNSPQRRTTRKQQRYGSQSEGQWNNGDNSRHTISHKNPLSLKKSGARGKTQQSRLVIQDSFRYCAGCELPILAANIKSHEISCNEFKELNSMTNQQLLDRMRKKVARLQSQIPRKNLELNPEQIQQLRSHSTLIVEQSRSRSRGSPQSAKFRQNYSSAMKVGHKWCSAIQQINKLRWFLRILNKLENMTGDYRY